MVDCILQWFCIFFFFILWQQDKSVKDVSLKKMEERDKKKMDQLKKKLHTDDEGIQLTAIYCYQINYYFLIKQFNFCKVGNKFAMVFFIVLVWKRLSCIYFVWLGPKVKKNILWNPLRLSTHPFESQGVSNLCTLFPWQHHKNW